MTRANDASPARQRIPRISNNTSRTPTTTKTTTTTTTTTTASTTASTGVRKRVQAIDGGGGSHDDSSAGRGGGEASWEEMRQNFWGMIWRVLLVYGILSFLNSDSGSIFGKNGRGGGGSGRLASSLFGGAMMKGDGIHIADGSGRLYGEGLLDIRMLNSWDNGRRFGIRVYVVEENALKFKEGKGFVKEEGKVWEDTGFVYAFVGDANERAKNVSVKVPGDVIRGDEGSLWIHGVVYDERVDVNNEVEAMKGLDNGMVLIASERLVFWDEVADANVEKNLLEKTDEKTYKFNGVDESNEVIGESGGQELREEKTKLVPLLKPKMTLQMVSDFNAVSIRKVPQAIAEHIIFRPERGVYFPPLKWSNFWTLREEFVTMNDTLLGKDATAQVELDFRLMSFFKCFLFVQFESALKMQKGMGLLKDRDGDGMKRILRETNPFFLALTYAVSVAHSVLATLAFSNDIGHWKNMKSLEGVSVRSLSWQLGMEIIIFLYLLDNETSWMILIGNAVSVVIILWKFGKVVKIVPFGQRKLFGIIPCYKFEDRESYAERTKEYDDQAMKYLGYVLYPLVLCYSIYSLIYERHRGWYSWIIGSLVGAVYTFGFILMFPQIFINYKLKSVAHLPMKAMMYKTLNTVIDDLFSFIVKIPWMHRLACFRDDIVFAIFLYQRWIYPVDKTRMNEFGQEFGDEVEEKMEKKKKKKKTGMKKKKVVKRRKVVKKGEEVIDGEVPGDTASATETENVARQEDMAWLKESVLKKTE